MVYDTVPIYLGLAVAAFLLLLTYFWERLPKLMNLLSRRREEQSIPLEAIEGGAFDPVDASQKLIAAYMRGSMTTKQFREAAAMIGFPPPMIDDVVCEHDDKFGGHE